jgi:hypothetical protein
MTRPTQSHNIGIVAPTACPKCGYERPPGADACPRCGLLASRWASFVPPTGAGNAGLDALWGRVEAAWGEDAPHARFLEHAATQGALHLAAARYRSRLPDEKAQAGLDRAVKLALQLQQVTAQAPDPSLSKLAQLVKVAGLFLAALLAAATVWVLWVAMGRR